MFAGRTEIRFDAPISSSRTAVGYKMSTRLKELTASVGNATNAASTSTGKQACQYQLTRPVQLEVRCLRAPSVCSLRGNCTRATRWKWFHNTCAGSDDYIDCEVHARLLPAPPFCLISYIGYFRILHSHFNSSFFCLQYLRAQMSEVECQYLDGAQV